MTKRSEASSIICLKNHTWYMTLAYLLRILRTAMLWTNTNAYKRVPTRVPEACKGDLWGGLARPLEAVQRATGIASLPVPLSNQTDPAWSSLLGFCLQIGCSFEYLPWLKTTEPLQFYQRIVFPVVYAFRVRIFDKAYILERKKRSVKANANQVGNVLEVGLW